ncbi:hypothetical protein CGZ93_00645 [Enemella dayhoffiae]|uniref:Uncharacterized protein n=1 Tax=Enemella dayhoffiae TaxID=2016507 RepID=A0A255HC98_9ACTN|nr:hypothetical protein [Enemella dayhoffiae]OYO25012.1 hypothetical protein CGZ93_00645 [Enemella dayhoffiae]
MRMMTDGGGSSSNYALNTQREIMAIIGSPDSTALDRAETMWRDTAASARDIRGLIQKRLNDLTGEHGWTGPGATAYRNAIKRDLLDPLEAYAQQAQQNADALKPVNQAISSATGAALVNDIPWDRDTNWQVNRKEVDQSLWGKVDEFVTGKDEDFEKAKSEAPYLVVNGQKQTVDTVDHTHWETLLQIYPQLSQRTPVFQATDNQVSPQVHRFDQLMEALTLNSGQVSTVRGRADAVDTQLGQYAPAHDGGDDPGSQKQGDLGKLPGNPTDPGKLPGNPTDPGKLPGNPTDRGKLPGNPTDPGTNPGSGLPNENGPGNPTGPTPNLPDPNPTNPHHPTNPHPGWPESPIANEGPGQRPTHPDPSVIRPGGPDPMPPGSLRDPAEISSNLPTGTEAASLNNPGAAAGLSNLGAGPGLGGQGINSGSGIVPPMAPPMGPMGAPGSGGPGAMGRPGLGGLGAGAPGSGGPGGPGVGGKGGPGAGGPGTGGNPLGGRSGNSFGIGPNGRGMVNPGSVGPLAGPHGSGAPGSGSGLPGAPGMPMGNRKNDKKDSEETKKYNSWLEEDEDVWLDSQPQR